MRDKRIKLIYFSLRGSEVKDIDLGWKRILLFVSMVGIILTILVGSAIGLFTDFYHDTALSSLKKTNRNLKDQLAEMRKTIDHVQSQMQNLEGHDDDLRMIAGLDKIDKDMRNVGVGGSQYTMYDANSEFLPRETRNDVSDIRNLIDQLKRRIQLAKESQQEVERIFQENEESRKRLPTIQPVKDARVTDVFGPRFHPFLEKIIPHDGLDLAAPAGTPVYATAHGVVWEVKERYTQNKSYGKYVVINHGNGIMTKYAHLHSINVKRGQKVKRWETIGTVGSTGQSTGPHLHYEVQVNGDPKDPMEFIFDF